MQRLTLSLRFLAETAIAGGIAFMFGRMLTGHLLYYVWESTDFWFIVACFLTLLTLLAWTIACGIAIYKKYAARKFRKILILITASWMAVIFNIGADIFTTYYNPHVFTFLYRLKQAEDSKKNVPIEKLTDFAWEKLCFLGPYGSVDSLRNLVGDGYILNQIDTLNEGRSYLIFLLPDKHSLVVGVPRYFFDSGDAPKCLNYPDAKSLTL